MFLQVPVIFGQDFLEIPKLCIASNPVITYRNVIHVNIYKFLKVSSPFLHWIHKVRHRVVLLVLLVDKFINLAGIGDSLEFFVLLEFEIRRIQF